MASNNMNNNGIQAQNFWDFVAALQAASQNTQHQSFEDIETARAVAEATAEGAASNAEQLREEHENRRQHYREEAENFREQHRERAERMSEQRQQRIDRVREQTESQREQVQKERENLHNNLPGYGAEAYSAFTGPGGYGGFGFGGPKMFGNGEFGGFGGRGRGFFGGRGGHGRPHGHEHQRGSRHCGKDDSHNHHNNDADMPEGVAGPAEANHHNHHGPHRRGGPHNGPHAFGHRERGGPHQRGGPHRRGHHGRGPFGRGFPQGPGGARGALFDTTPIAEALSNLDLNGVLAQLACEPWAQALRPFAEANGFGHLFDEEQQPDGARGQEGEGVDFAASPDTIGRESAEQDSSAMEATFTPPVDIFAAEDAWTLHVALPGARKEDVGVNWDVERDTLNIAGVTFRAGGEKSMGMELVGQGERKIGVFERVIELPPRGAAKEKKEREIDGDAITAKLEDGILVVRVPKKAVTEQDWEDVRKVAIE